MRVSTTREIGALIRGRRRDRGWDQATLAQHIGVSRLWISQVENGKSSVQLDLVLRTLAVLRITLDAIELPEPTGSSDEQLSSAALIAHLLRDRT